MREKIRKLIEAATGQKEISFETPKETSFGDLSLNIAMSLARELKKPPREVAGEIKSKIEQIDKGEIIDRIEIAGPGYINLFIKDSFIRSSMKDVMQKRDDYGKSDVGGNKKVLIEFVSANPTGPLHIGHGRWAAIGDSIANILKFTGYEVHKEFYINNVGKQINMLLASVNAVKNGSAIPEGGYGGSYIKDIVERIKENPGHDQKMFVLETILEGQKKTLQSAGVTFDEWFSESTLHESGLVASTVEKLKQKGHTYEKDGAVWFKSEEFGDDKDRVLIRENGEPTYFSADITYHAEKFRRGYDFLINVWGTDHHGYVKRLQSAIEALGLPSHRLDIIIGQLVTLYRGDEPVRMSKRTGEMITFQEVIDEIGSDAVRFFLLMTGADSHMDFDLELAKKKSLDNPVYYVQYAYARICNIIKNSDMPVPAFEEADLSLLKEGPERDIMKKMLDLPEEVISSSKAMQPHHLVRYARELAALFHSYYHKCRVISEDKDMMKARLILIESARIVFSNVLKLLGISAPERM